MWFGSVQFNFPDSIHIIYSPFWILLFQRLEYLSVDLVHVEGLEGRKGSFHPKERNNWAVDAFNGHNEIASSGLYNCMGVSHRDECKPKPKPNRESGGGKKTSQTKEVLKKEIIIQNKNIKKKRESRLRRYLWFELATHRFILSCTHTHTHLFFVDFHKSSIPHRLGDFVGSSLECVSLLARFHDDGGFAAVGLCLGSRRSSLLFRSLLVRSNGGLFWLGFGRRRGFLLGWGLFLGSLGRGSISLGKPLGTSGGDHGND